MIDRQHLYYFTQDTAVINSNYTFPKLNNDQLFEELACRIFAHEFKNPNLQLYGRRGQKQDGIDIIGNHYIVGQDFPKGKLTAIQCKNHTVEVSDKQLKNEIDRELARLDDSPLPIEQYVFVTSADNSKPVIDHVTQLRIQRVNEGKCPIFIQFWDFVTDKIGSNPELLFEYFTKLLPLHKTENISLPDLHQTTHQTLSVSVDALLKPNSHADLLPQLQKTARKNLSGIEPSAPYNVYIGLSTHKNVHFREKVDLDINCSPLFSNTSRLEEKYEKIIVAISNLVALLSDPFFSRNIVLYTDIEINFAFLLGRAFRVHKRHLMLIAKEQVWTSDRQRVPIALPEIVEERPQFHDLQDKDNEAAFIFNATTRTHIMDDVQDSLRRWTKYPNIITSYRLKKGSISNSAHALSVAQSIAQRIHNLESWNVKTIHTFLVMPKPLAMLVGYYLNTLNSELRLYFMNPDRDTYLETGKLTNNTFR